MWLLQQFPTAAATWVMNMPHSIMWSSKRSKGACVKDKRATSDTELRHQYWHFISSNRSISSLLCGLTTSLRPIGRTHWFSVVSSHRFTRIHGHSARTSWSYLPLFKFGKKKTYVLKINYWRIIFWRNPSCCLIILRNAIQCKKRRQTDTL